MGTRGPKPVITGKGGLSFESGIPKCPDWLCDEAREEYARVARYLDEAGVVQLVDLAYLSSYAQAYAEVVQLTKNIARDGTSIAGAQGGMIQNPDVRTRTTVFSQMSTAAGKLGFSPTDRERLSRPEKPKEEDGVDRFLAG